MPDKEEIKRPKKKRKPPVSEESEDDESGDEDENSPDISDHGLTATKKYIMPAHLANIVVKLSPLLTYTERIALCDHYDKRSTGLPVDQAPYECLMHRAHFVIRYRKVCVL